MTIMGYRDDLLAGRVALVTGAARGIGLATGRALAAAGARVVLADIDAGALARAVGEFGAAAAPESAVVDIASLESVQACAARVRERAGPVSVLVNNAGVFERVAAGDADAVAAWRRVLAVNADGPYHVTHAFLGQLRETRGTVVNVASTWAFTAAEAASAYTASKGALVAMTKALAVELAPFGIRVNAVAPSDVRTRMIEGGAGTGEIQAALYARTPLGRPAEPEEIAAAILFLASPLSSFVTGAVLPVDGGFLAT